MTQPVEALPHQFLNTTAGTSAPVLRRLIGWLNRHPVWLALITIAYVVYIITLHDVMQRPALWAQKRLSPQGWNKLVAAVAIPILCIFCIWVGLALRRHSRVWVAGGYFVVASVLAVICFRTLLVMNIEAVHFVQYAILAMLLFAMAGGFSQAIIWATLIGLVDEAYQYFYLHEHWRVYMDFNDVILNTVGAGLGLVTLYACGMFSTSLGPPRRRRFLSIAAGIAVGTLSLGAAGMYAVGLLRVLPDPHASGWSIILRRSGPATEFWTRPGWGSGKAFHEVQPIEWVALTLVLIIFNACLDRLGPKTQTA